MNVIDEAQLNKQPFDHDDEYISRTEFKHESAEIQKFGEQLAALSKKQLQMMELDEFLFDNLVKVKTIKPKTEAYRRQMQYIGKLMRTADLDEVKQKFQKLHLLTGNETIQVQKFERIRDEVLAEGDSKIHELISEHPQLDRQKLRQLVRQAKKELAKNPESKANKELFVYLRQNW
ncbi:ribosome-associated protein [Parashewanella curva]|uniref:Dual-action ribosomal maturation protein DarP n=1 Tax=Parashewanella curva TaxID=2338552 RepID=A0A3L8PWM6_9GAMM|nr:ribosome biogenesis factor YjgA [Parashewanella curva]RLV59023.1 ribosome-associated protein [Parashewanella curva]